MPVEELETARREVTLVYILWWRPGFCVRTHLRYIGGRVGLVDSARDKDKSARSGWDFTALILTGGDTAAYTPLITLDRQSTIDEGGDAGEPAAWLVLGKGEGGPVLHALRSAWVLENSNERY